MFPGPFEVNKNSLSSLKYQMDPCLSKWSDGSDWRIQNSGSNSSFYGRFIVRNVFYARILKLQEGDWSSPVEGSTALVSDSVVDEGEDAGGARGRSSWGQAAGGRGARGVWTIIINW